MTLFPWLFADTVPVYPYTLVASSSLVLHFPFQPTMSRSNKFISCKLSTKGKVL
jgi:hypothetical protein